MFPWINILSKFELYDGTAVFRMLFLMLLQDKKQIKSWFHTKHLQIYHEHANDNSNARQHTSEPWVTLLVSAVIISINLLLLWGGNQNAIGRFIKAYQKIISDKNKI